MIRNGRALRTSNVRRPTRPFLASTAAALIAGAVVLGACSGSNSADPAPTSGPTAAPAVTIKAFQFSPNPARVPAGTVSVVNADSTTHTFTSGTPGSPDGTFDVRLTGPNASGSVRLGPGTYRFFCKIHTSMTGELVVT